MTHGGRDATGRSRRLYVYWRLARADLPAALRATRAMQQRLQAAHPGLRCALLEREDPPAPDSDATLMEIYSSDAGIDAALESAIEAAAGPALAPFRRGPRHAEVFHGR